MKDMTRAMTDREGWQYTQTYIYIYIYIYISKQLIGIVGRVFANRPEDLDSNSGRLIPNTLKWYLIHP